MVSSAKLKTLILQFEDFFNYLNGFRDLMGFDYIYNIQQIGMKTVLSYVKDDKQYDVPLSFSRMKESYESWLEEKDRVRLK